MQARYVQTARAGAPLEMSIRDVPEPTAGQVRVRVQACGVCHSDSVTVDGVFPWIVYPRVPGHEIIGLVDAIGEGVPQWKVGQRVGIGWYGGHCGRCEPCRRGDMVACENSMIPGVTYDGGYADYVVAPADALAAVPRGSRARTRLRSFVPESRPSMLCGIPVRARQTRSPCLAWVGWVTSECSSPPR